MAQTWPGFAVSEGSERPMVPLVITGYDPAWPQTYERWRQRVAAALGRTAIRIDHVGSTSVPGLAAKPIVDIQVSVADPGGEPRYVPPLQAIGLVLRSRDELHRFLRPPAGQPREVHVHVCAAGGQWENDHLLFRDYLRAHPAACRRYAEAKRAAVVSDGPAPAPRTHDYRHIPGMSATVVWATAPGQPADATDPTPGLRSQLPGPGGTCFVIVRFPPDDVLGTADPPVP
jgi:GrpB-like predicted nucleotidyltransferase (UPF0157 family)